MQQQRGSESGSFGNLTFVNKVTADGHNLSSAWTATSPRGQTTGGTLRRRSTTFAACCFAPNGDGCVVCHSPAWVKDIQINRQLSSIIQLFCGLDSLINPMDPPDSSVPEIQTQPASPVSKHKKNFKIWFSPRSRKVRCTVERPSEVTAPDNRSTGETAAAQPDTITAQHQDLSVFNFTSSSQDSGSSSQRRNTENVNRKKRSTKTNAASRKALARGATRTTQKHTGQKMKKTRLEAINKQWGVTEEVDTPEEKEEHCAEGTRRSSKRVSFLSPAVISDEPQPEVPQGSSADLSPGKSNARERHSGGSTTEMIYHASADQNTSDSVIQQNTPSSIDLEPNDDPEKQVNVSTPKNSSKRTRLVEKIGPLETTPKRPRVSPGRRRKSPGQISPVVLIRPFLTSPRNEKSNNNICREERGQSPSDLAAVGRKSPGTPGAALGRLSSGSPAVMKRNHKGETLLHLAAIKGDVEAVKELLDQGADPNLKDNAGWTPLHEACNLGHVEVVEALISRGALLNTPGYENDSPLHDAVRNGHPAIVKLLLQHGASQNVLNLYGKRPADYALPPLFDGCFFFLLGSFKAPAKDKLTKLLREGGGQLLSRQPKPDSDVTQTLSAAAYHALPGSDQALCTQYIIFDPLGPHKPTVVRRGKVWSAPSTWIIDCIAAFRLLPVSEPQALL
ncbi:hypothetical protein F2P81_020982 [Scophthalmus maximus]|uniref:BRCT domain-containing protein n=1 Tax=Scophthalmus maximus TaxID=52904 RepID=A0A6A4S1V5_SCOMX|nr:hypothetical protein F2P81_020982 [Scophthalmus maximus]